MKRIFAILLLAVMVGCASTPSKNTSLKAAYDTVDAYVLSSAAAYQRGRITRTQAIKASDNAKNATAVIDKAAAALVDCKPPCSEAATLLQSLQPLLLEFEAELRQRESK